MILPLLSNILIFHGGCDVKISGVTVTLPSSPEQLVFSVIKFDCIPEPTVIFIESTIVPRALTCHCCIVCSCG